MARTRWPRKSGKDAEEAVEKVQEVVKDAKPDSDFSLELPPAKKPRRKSQAFGVPKTAALKAKIDRNAADSPLLSLPREVRARIWKLVIGDRLLHIEQKCKEHPASEDCQGKEKHWTTFCCIAPYKEEELFQRSKLPLEELATRDDGEYGEYLDANKSQMLPTSAASRQRLREMQLQKHTHRRCRMFIEYVRAKKCNLLEGRALQRYKDKDYILPVQILQVSRQVYIEANPLLWSSNTLAFSGPLQFSRFMAERISSQKASITSLLLELSWGERGSATYGEGPRATTSTIINALGGLRTLHLYLQDEFRDPSNPLWGGTAISENELVGVWRSYAEAYETREGFTNFKQLPLENVTVLMFDDETNSLFGEMPPWRRAEQAKYAEEVKGTILDPEGPKKFEQEQAHARAAREAAQEENKLAWAPCKKASTEDECAQIAQAALERRASCTGKSGKTKTRVRECFYEHVCLLCLNTLKRTREDARKCQKPGKCDEAYFSIMFINKYSPQKSMNIPVQKGDTMSNILERYIDVSGANTYYSYHLRLDGVKLKAEATVQEVGLRKNSDMEIVVAVTKTEGIPYPVWYSDSSDTDNPG